MTLNLKQSDNFIDILSYYLVEDISKNFTNTQFENILNKFVLFDKNENDFMFRFMNNLNFIVKFRHQDNSILKDFISKSKPNSQLYAFGFLLDSNPFSDIDYLKLVD